jgi:hypothetical protein
MARKICKQSDGRDEPKSNAVATDFQSQFVDAVAGFSFHESDGE